MTGASFNSPFESSALLGEEMRGRPGTAPVCRAPGTSGVVRLQRESGARVRESGARVRTWAGRSLPCTLLSLCICCFGRVASCPQTRLARLLTTRWGGGWWEVCYLVRGGQPGLVGTEHGEGGAKARGGPETDRCSRKLELDEPSGVSGDERGGSGHLSRKWEGSPHPFRWCFKEESNCKIRGPGGGTQTGYLHVTLSWWHESSQTIY